MSIWMEIAVFLIYAGVLMVIYLFGKVLVMPAKVIGRVLLNSAAGGVFILLVNYFGDVLGLHIPLNILTALTTGLLGLPGACMLLLVFNF